MNVYEEVSRFYENFEGEKKIIGESEEGRALYAFFIGRHEPPVGISQAAIHGREYITALLSLAHIERGIKRGGFWVLPLTNPDGALLSEEGISSVREKKILLEMNGGTDFSLWKANARGVDLNVNFDAKWGDGVKNLRFPGPENDIGEAPFCAKESMALAAFTREISPDLTVSWHTKGEEIYWRFFQPFFRRQRDRRLAKILSRAVNCPLREAKGSVGGYKDWCIEKLKIPAFTVEVGSENLTHPIKREYLIELIERYGGALNALAEGFHGRAIHA